MKKLLAIFLILCTTPAMAKSKVDLKDPEYIVYSVGSASIYEFRNSVGELCTAVFSSQGVGISCSDRYNNTPSTTLKKPSLK